jgi:CO/xanthine dehydrogenase Mo-binding subunit
MADQKLVGGIYTPPDLVAKVTGRAKYAEDYRADGMLFTKLLLSPMPHARVTRIDTRAALALPGVKALLTADDLPDLRGAERALTNEPLYQGEPILAVAAVDEVTAAEAIERIDVHFEALPFVVDPVDSLRPGGANGRVDGNVWFPAAPAANATAQPPRPTIQTLKWTDDDFAKAPEGGLPMSSTRRSSFSPPAISRWRPAARWRTGRTARCTCTGPRRASRARWIHSPAGSASTRRTSC